MGAQDFALLVGIGDYPHTTYPHLDGPKNDIEYFYDWLVNPAGGAVPPQNIYKKMSPDPAIDPPPVAYQPTPSEIWADFKAIVTPGKVLTERLDGKVYLYFSGHGFADFSAKPKHAALYAGNADEVYADNVCGTTMAMWCEEAAAFGEVILIMDCCRDQEVFKQAAGAQINRAVSPNAGQVRRFEVYAVPFGGKAQERAFKQRGGKVQGLLTYAVVNALQHAPAIGGVRDANAIKKFILGVWGTVIGNTRVEQPEFIVAGPNDVDFSASPAQDKERTVHLSSHLTSPATLEVILSGTPVVQIQLDPVAKTQTTVSLATNAASPAVEFDGTQIGLRLPVALYELVLRRPDLPEVVGALHMIGDEDAVLPV